MVKDYCMGLELLNSLKIKIFKEIRLAANVFSPTTVQVSWHCFGGLPSTLLVFSFWVSAMSEFCQGFVRVLSGF
ncbi:hypothetical protein M0802_011803 [Mischocyttarus mexicanus]|nr:hypothetical protein M0802_011803 [Mischocyttarus mexicanus]